MRAEPLELSNPLTAAQSLLRTSLIPGLLSVIGRNAPVEQEGIRIFELGRVFLQRESQAGLPNEELHLTAAMTRKAAPLQWIEKQRDADFFDVKGEIEALLEQFGVNEQVRMGREAVQNRPHAFDWFLQDRKLAECGMLPQRIPQRYDIETPVFYFDILVDALPAAGRGDGVYARISPYPPVRRDLCLVSGDRVRFSEIRRVIEQGAKYLESIRLFDYYRGGHLGESKKSYTFRLSFRSKETTLADGDVDRQIEKILGDLKRELQVTLRKQ